MLCARGELLKVFTETQVPTAGDVSATCATSRWAVAWLAFGKCSSDDTRHFTVVFTVNHFASAYHAIIARAISRFPRETLTAEIFENAARPNFIGKT
jgi:hypothetical protein